MRRIVLVLILGAGSLSLGLAASQQQGPRVVEIDEVRENLFVLRGGGGNTAVFVQGNGVTVVDTKSPGWGQPILDAIR